jgi:signal transduction histidine kinase
MKLLTRTIIYYALMSVPLLLIAGIAFYFIITSELNKSMDESLLNTKKQLENYLNAKQDTGNYAAPDGDSFMQFMSGPPDTNISFKDTLIFDLTEEEYLPYRILTAEVPFKNDHYQIKIRKASIETEDVIDGIVISIFIVFVILFVGLVGLSWWINKKLWKPFYDTLTYLSYYKIGTKNNFHFEPTSISEFNSLNLSLDKMLERIGRDYQKQKEFTENAAHEMQTPVAVMQSKIDLLIQSKNLKEEEMQLIDQLGNALQKLSHLNRSLLLLSKIENKQFGEPENISIQEVLENSLSLYENGIASKKIEVTKDYLVDPIIPINRGLCEILINNLIQNAVRHNIQSGVIEINVDHSTVVIRNTGEAIMNAATIFERFTKSDRSINSIGLGLAIVREIANASGMSITYHFRDNKNCFILSFKI